jgi:alkane 1-monooxygenase
MKASVLRASDLRFLLGIALPASTLNAVVNRPERAWIGTLVIFLTVATLEAAWPRLARSPPPAGPGSPLPWLLRLYVPLQLVLIACGLVAARGASWGTVFGLAFSVGFVAGAQGITYAHELGHGRQRADRALAWILLASVNYPQFMVEHYRGHHVRAATWDDPASSRPGEGLWAFLPRTLAGSLRSAWQLEAARLAQFRRGWGASPLLWWTLADAGAILALAALGQWKMLAFWLLQSAMAVWLLETVNYIEHYGLQRRPGPDGRPEPFGVAHAWNADHAVSNSLLANLQRHSDHHMHAWKPFPELEALPGPQLPTGYAGCLLLAAVPPVWFAVMHPRLTETGAATAIASPQ